jgi:hypothetical protein
MDEKCEVWLTKKVETIIDVGHSLRFVDAKVYTRQQFPVSHSLYRVDMLTWLVHVMDCIDIIAN